MAKKPPTRSASTKSTSAAIAPDKVSVAPLLHQQQDTGSRETQLFDEVVPRPHGLDQKVARQSVQMLNQSLADTITLRDMYELHLMYDQPFEAQVALVDSIAERIQVLGGISLAMAADVAEATKVPRPPRGREPAAVQLSRLIDAHTLIIKDARESAEKASDAGDSGTDDLLVSEVVRTNELQVWFLSEHLVAASPV